MIQVEVVVPLSAHQMPCLEAFVAAINLMSTVELEVSFALSSGLAEDSVVADGIKPLQQLSVPWRIARDSGTELRGYNDMADEAIKACTAPFLLMLPVTHRLHDKEWFGKLQGPMRHDRFCGFVGAFDKIEWNTLPPTRLGKREAPLGKAFFGRTKAIQACKIGFDPRGDDIAVPVSFCVREQGLTAWMARAVRLLVSEHPWERPLEQQVQHDAAGW